MLPNVLKVAEFFPSYLLADGGQTTTGSLWKNGQSQWDQESVCRQKKPSWSHCWSCSGEGLGTEEGAQGCSLEHEREVFPTFCPPPGLGSKEIQLPRSQTAHSALLLGGDPFPTENTINPKPCLRKKLELFKNKALLVQGATATAK